MAKKKITLTVFSLIALALLGTLTSAVIIYGIWFSGASTVTIAKGDSANFTLNVGSFDPPMHYTVKLYDANYNYVSTLRDTSFSGQHSQEVIIVTPADYNNLGGTYHVVVSATDAVGADTNNALTLIVTQNTPTFSSNLPDITMAKNSVYTLNLNNYVSDSDDSLSSLTWTISPSTLVSSSISNGALTLTSNSSLGSETLTVTVCDASNACSSDSFVLTVASSFAYYEPSSTAADTEVSVKNLGIQAFGDGLLLIRNHGIAYDLISLNVEIEDENAQSNLFRFSLSPNTVKYINLNTQGLSSGDHLARLEVSSDDSSESGYLLITV